MIHKKYWFEFSIQYRRLSPLFVHFAFQSTNSLFDFAFSKKASFENLWIVTLKKGFEITVNNLISLKPYILKPISP